MVSKTLPYFLLFLFFLLPLSLNAQEEEVPVEETTPTETPEETLLLQEAAPSETPEETAPPEETTIITRPTREETFEDNTTPLPNDFMPTHKSKTVLLQTLNKVNARVSKLEIETGKTGEFGNVEIKLWDCWKSPPEEKPEAAALLQISEQKPDEDKQQIFLGWMFASSPALSALEHPVYDITVLECQNEIKP